MKKNLSIVVLLLVVLPFVFSGCAQQQTGKISKPQDFRIKKVIEKESEPVQVRF